jgi:hypothetical protein
VQRTTNTHRTLQHETRRSQTIATATNTATAPEVVDFNHINLNEIDDSRKPIEDNVYTLEINKIDTVYKEVKKPDSAYLGQTLQYLKGSYTVVDDPKYSGRKFWGDFCTAFKVPLIFLKKQQDATGVRQSEGQTLSDWAEQFALLSPPARLQVHIQLGKDKRDPEGPDVNIINWFTAKPV